MIIKTREGMENMSKEEETVKTTKQIFKNRQSKSLKRDKQESKLNN